MCTRSSYNCYIIDDSHGRRLSPYTQSRSAPSSQVPSRPSRGAFDSTSCANDYKLRERSRERPVDRSTISRQASFRRLSEAGNGVLCGVCVSVSTNTSALPQVLFPFSKRVRACNPASSPNWSNIPTPENTMVRMTAHDPSGSAHSTLINLLNDRLCLAETACLLCYDASRDQDVCTAAA